MVICKADAKTAFLKTGMAERDVYKLPLRELSMHVRFVWLIQTGAYGLVNSGNKWQHQSDQLMSQLGLVQCESIPQLFFKRKRSGE